MKADLSSGNYRRDVFREFSRRQEKTGLARSLSLIKQSGLLDYRLTLLNTKHGRNEVGRVIFGDDGKLVKQYKSLAQLIRKQMSEDGCNWKNPEAVSQYFLHKICSQETSRDVESFLKGSIYFSPTAILVDQVIGDKIADMVERTYSVVGSREVGVHD